MVYKQQKFISHSSGGWKSEFRVTAGQDFFFWTENFSLYPLMVEWGREPGEMAGLPGGDRHPVIYWAAAL